LSCTRANHHHKPFGSQFNSIDGLQDRRRVGGLWSWSLAVSWKADESIIGRVHVSVGRVSYCVPPLASTMSTSLYNIRVMVRIRLAQGSNLRQNKLLFFIMRRTCCISALFAQATQHAHHTQYHVSDFLLSITALLHTAASDDDAVDWIGVRTLRFQPSSTAAASHSELTSYNSTRIRCLPVVFSSQVNAREAN